LVLAGLTSGLRAAGPNMLVNSSFEGGIAGWNSTSPFIAVNSAANAHTGSWELQAVLTSSPAYQRCYQNLSVWANTAYVSTIWIKGSGSLQFGVLNTTNYATISSVTITATSTWQPVTLNWNSGSYTGVAVYLYDTITGNKGNTVSLDDCQTGLAVLLVGRP
jgi:hypothetical protein